MDNKLSELSKPVATVDVQRGRPDGNMFGVAWSSAGHAIPDGPHFLYSQEYVSALLEKSKEKDERAIACVNAFEGIDTERIAGKSLGEFLAGELYLNKAEPKQDGSFGFTFSGLAVQLMADCFADQFKSSGAINYLELLFEHAEVGEMTVTMQRVEGLTPAQKLAAAEQRIAELEAIRADTSQVFKEIGNELGCNPDNESIMMAIDELKSTQMTGPLKDVLKRNIELEAKLATPVRLPAAKDPSRGWTIDPDYLSAIADKVGHAEDGGSPSMETVEAVLLATGFTVGDE
ncbi:hypothetical protein FKD06_07720 [Serratia sp. SRS-8-S-2018]|uniref:hypothetical protein n=1 Tax=Serratia sp. SRS-8-S-2018 TaxID=2591107 RepID=UPI0011408452|nr:hypothetical protein [Serratia sp. SRS-8-S-2018]TPW52386.1 hypothetical protein FKD06_07720 [Serratia sp. SRS-8-S-2018]